MFEGSNYDSGPSNENPTAIHSDFLFAASWLRENSGAEDLVGTNKHCIVGGLVNSNCESRWFAGTALSERRFLVEGFASTSRGPFPEYWNPAALKEVDQFISSPSADGLRRIREMDVEWLLVDKRESYSENLGSFVQIMVDNDHAIVAKVGL